MADSTTITLTNPQLFKQQLLQWACHFKVACLLDNNNYTENTYHSLEWVLAVDAVNELHINGNPFEELKQFHSGAKSNIYGFLTYDLKNHIEKLQSRHPNRPGFPEMYFFEPRYIFQIEGSKLTVNRNYPETFELHELINKIKTDKEYSTPAIKLKARTQKEKYLQQVERIKKQIEEGDFYELNYCLEFYNDDATINPLVVFNKLNQTAKAPFSCFFKLEDKYLLCASPERFLKKEGDKLISQPIKGTIRKGATLEENEALGLQLKNDIKERAENVMIVDLVRNDLAHSSVAGTVKVDELFGIYNFNSVIQMISTVTSQIRSDIPFVDAIKNAFPMGSMTGAPKICVMENIDLLEDFRRGLYSGAVGYITPQGNFDFNVVIRSILYNAHTKYLSISAGGAITYGSVPEKEYEEVLLKAKNMVAVVNGTLPTTEAHE